MGSRDARRTEIRRQYRIWRAAAGKSGLTQGEVEQLARKLYPEFRAGAFWKIENGWDYPTPTERKALSKVLGVTEADLPSEQAVAKAS